MFLERISSLHHLSLFPFNLKEAEWKHSINKHKPLLRCNYKTIPPPSKSLFEHRVYHLYGDVILMEKEGTLCFEASLLNKFKTFNEVMITKLSNQKLVTIFPEKRKDFEQKDWTVLVERLYQACNVESLEWAEIINNFCRKSQAAIEICASGKNLINEREKEIFNHLNKNSKEKRANLLETHPCLALKTSLNSKGFGLTEISLNEKFLSEMGYSVDTFSSTILQEGLAQFMPHDDKLASNTIKSFMKSCFEIDSNTLQVLEFDSMIFMKSGYIKNVKFQMHLLPMYENESFELDRILVLTSKELPYFDENRLPQMVLSKEFWEIMIAKEHDLNFFLNKYYGKSPSMRYTHLDRICRIREIKKSSKKIEKIKPVEKRIFFSNF